MPVSNAGVETRISFALQAFINELPQAVSCRRHGGCRLTHTILHELSWESKPAPPLRRTSSDHSGLKHGLLGIVDGWREPGSHAPFNQWCSRPKVSLGPNRAPIIGDASPKALPQARVHNSRHLGPAPPGPEPLSGTVRESVTGRQGRCGGGGIVRSPAKPLRVFWAGQCSIGSGGPRSLTQGPTCLTLRAVLAPSGLPASRELHLPRVWPGFLPARTANRQVPSPSISPLTPRIERDAV